MNLPWYFTCRQFLKDFIRNNSRQVCFCAKDFLIVLLKYLNAENADAGHNYGMYFMFI